MNQLAYIHTYCPFAFLGRGSSQNIPTEDEKLSSRRDEVMVGDMTFTRKQYELLYGEAFGRNGIPEIWKGEFKRWTDNKLPYIIDPSISPSNEAIIENTISKFNSEMGDCFNIV